VAESFAAAPTDPKETSMTGRFVALMLAVSLAVVIVTAPKVLGEEARPNADEDCVLQCDKESDKCMAEAGSDESKAKACDDRYSECLSKCK
jgi:hypothetical protein